MDCNKIKKYCVFQNKCVYLHYDFERGIFLIISLEIVCKMPN